MASNETQRSIEAHKKWLGYLQPDGLVVSAAALVDKGHYYNQAQRERQLELIDHLDAFQQHDDEEGTVEITDFKALATNFLGWPQQEWADAADLGDTYHIRLKESAEILSPTAALRWPRGKELSAEDSPYQLLIWEHPAEINGKAVDFDTPYEVIQNTWSTSATRRMERMLRETGVPIGLLVSPTALRLIYAPTGENAGSLTFRFADMLSTMGRPILGAFDLLLGVDMLFLGEEAHQLPALLKHSRDMQANVSIELARQVLDGLYDLVRGTQAADARTAGQLLRQLLATNPNLIYEGQLTVLMRLVFLLFAEDRGLMPNSELYNRHYSVHSLYERLRQDHAIDSENMDARYGAWAQLLALFRLIFHGHRHKDLQLPARYGYLFDPDRFPFLEGRYLDSENQQPTIENPQSEIPLIPDGTIFRLLQRLLFLNGERISYRTLDVEQIGSVYETMMGFGLTRADGCTIAIRPQKRHGAPVNLDLDHVLTLKVADRHKLFTEETGRKLTGTRLTEFNTAATVEELLAALQGTAANSNLVAVNATPHLAQPGSLLLQPTDARRKSGSHYTAKKLTEPIVRKALEPIFAILGEHPFPAQILDLKICDPAVGSGAFLVEVCRQLADALVKAWAYHGGKPVIPPDEDEVLHARRLVAQRCLYGVDRNPMAADLTKLSLWLATLAKDHPFTFLDHAIRSGDSLVGLSKKQILAFHWDLSHPSAKQRVFGQDVLEKKIKAALAYRQEILNAGDYVLPELKAAQLKLAEQEIDKVRRAGDLAVLGFFSGSKPKERQEARDRFLERWLKATDQSGSEESLSQGIALKQEVQRAREDEKPVAPFHWEVEFPEVFERKPRGFDALIGNPPYAGVVTLSVANHPTYTDFLRFETPGSGGKCDLVAFFFRRAWTYSREGGTISFLATSTVSEGDTRRSGLSFIVEEGGIIYAAQRSFKWPGTANVYVTVVHITKADQIVCSLDGKPCRCINAFLLNSSAKGEPYKLASNAKLSFVGAKPGSKWHVVGDAENGNLPAAAVDEILAKHPEEAEGIREYLGGSELYDDPHQKSHRLANYLGLMDSDQVRDFPYLMELLRQTAKQERNAPDGWWQFARRAVDLYSRLPNYQTVLVRAEVSSTFAFTRLKAGCVFSNKCLVFLLEPYSAFACLQSGVHEYWARMTSSTQGQGLSYVPSYSLDTFPFPKNWDSDSKLEQIGREYYDYRAALMIRNDEGLTKTYNRFHNPAETSPEIHRLRELHAAMDRAVLDTYGWTEVPTDCEFIPDFTEEDDDGNEIPKNIRYRWPDEVRDDVLARLLALNAERYQAEVNAGLHAKATKTAKKKTAKKAAKKKTAPTIADLPSERELDFVATLHLPLWAALIPKFTYPLSSLPRTNANNGIAYYRAVIPAMVQEAGGTLPLNLLFDAISRLEDKDDLLEATENIPASTKKKWSKSFAEPVDANSFGSALESLCEVGQDIRLVGSRDNLQLRFVKESSITLDWYLLDAQILLTAEAEAWKRKETTREAPAELIDRIIPFATAS